MGFGVDLDLGATTRIVEGKYLGCPDCAHGVRAADQVNQSHGCEHQVPDPFREGSCNGLVTDKAQGG